MKTIFRSIINVRKGGKPTIEQSDLKKNYKAFLASSIEPEDPAYIKLYHWIEGHFREYNELPSIELLSERALENGEEQVVATLKDIAEQTPYISSDYRAKLKSKLDEQRKNKLQNILTKTWQIANDEMKIGKRKYSGIGDSLQYLIAETRQLRLRNTEIKNQINLRDTAEGAEVLKEYQRKKINPLNSAGMYTFYQKIDDVTRGLHPGQLMIIAGFTGNGKSTLSANLAYNGIMQGYNGLYIPLESPIDEVRDMIYILHASNAEWFEHPKYKNLAGRLSYDKMRYGEFNELEEDFFQAVIHDFTTNEEYGQLYMHQPEMSPFLISDMEVLAYDYDAQLKESGRQLDFIVIDYVGLMGSDKRYSDRNEEVNANIRALKNFALSFDNSRKIRVISPFQINREGWREAVKNDGLYNLHRLAGAHEAERTCDLIIGAFMSPEMKRNGIIKISCMKHRQGADFDPFEARIDHNSKQIRDFISTEPEGAENIIKEFSDVLEQEV